jgi:hypothetical protein
MFIKDLVMWRHYNIILENSDIIKRPWQHLAINDNWNLLSAYVIWNIRAHVGGRFGRGSRLVAAHFAFSRPKREVEVAL